MNIGDTVKVFSSTSDYDGHTGRIVYIGSAPGAPAPYVVQFGDAISEPFSERELVSLKPIEPLWREHPLETGSAPHGASTRVQMYLGRIIAQKFMRSERRRMMLDTNESARRRTLEALGSEITHGRVTLSALGYAPCLKCGKLFCSHLFKGD